MESFVWVPVASVPIGSTIVSVVWYHWYIGFPVPLVYAILIVMFAPTHMVESSGCSVNVGLGTIVNSSVAVLSQLLLLVVRNE